MKKLIAVFSLILMAICAHAQVSIAPVQQGPTAEDTADGFAKNGVDYWIGQYNFIGTPTNGVAVGVNANFTLQLKSGRWAITQLRIDNQEYPIDANHPLWMLPSYKGTVSSFNLWIQGYNKQGNSLRNGSFYSQNLKPGDKIAVNIYLNYVGGRLPYQLTGDQNSSNTGIVSDDGLYTGWYDSGSGAFVFSYDPLNPPTKFLVIDYRDNSVIGEISFNPGYSGGGGSVAGNGIDLNLPYGTLETSMTTSDSYVNFNGIALDQTVTRSNANYSAKMAIYHTAKSTDYVQVLAYGLRSGSWLEVWGYDGDGNTHLLGRVVVPNDNGWTIPIYNLTGYNNYKAVLVGVNLSPISGSSLGIYRSDYSWYWYGDGGGGKGKTGTETEN